MDPTRFDEFVRSLAQPASRRGALGVAVGGALALLDATTGAAKRRHRRGQAAPAASCKADGKACAKDNQCCSGNCPGGAGGSVGHSAGICCAAGQVQHPAGTCCTDDGTACSGKCSGSATNNCGQTVSCACPTGRVCLSNGTCAVPCPNGGSDCSACGNRCLSTNEGNVCSAGGLGGDCNNNNANCPTGQACGGAFCENVC